ncbi:VOC family protein [Aurantiacibacter gilvus]|uniref:VOC family protein n=1 Tax=Aurantiacibacter gilvus TaxID=3139141 RepID=A0ABU9IFH9_9SPHN
MIAQPRVSDLHYVALAVPDLGSEREFFTEKWGLVEVAERDGMVYLAAEGVAHPYVIRLRQDDVRKIDLIGFSAPDAQSVDALRESVSAAGGKIIGEPALLDRPFGGYGFRFFDIDGHAIEVVADNERREARELSKGEAIPTGLSHIVLHSPSVQGLVDFYQRALGFRLSDAIGEFMLFLRCNSAHHRLAILPGPASLNHVAFDVLSVDELMRGLGRLNKSGVPVQWGPGRHTAGDNTFTYYLTPNGNVVEYTSDLEEVDDENWQPQVYKFSPSITDQWGTGRIMANAPHTPAGEDPGLWQEPV